MIGLEWGGRTVWFRPRHALLALRTATVLRQRSTPYHWRIKR